jgi:hypothetical protein
MGLGFKGRRHGRFCSAKNDGCLSDQIRWLRAAELDLAQAGSRFPGPSLGCSLGGGERARGLGRASVQAAGPLAMPRAHARRPSTAAGPCESHRVDRYDSKSALGREERSAHEKAVGQQAAGLNA